jgi:hypothetical protein
MLTGYYQNGDITCPAMVLNKICSWLAANSFIPAKEISKVPAGIGQGK